MKIGIVGSRRRTEKDLVRKVVNSLDSCDVVVSGGCEGVDTWAEEAAKTRGLQVIIFKPDLTNIKNEWDMISRYYARNKQIAEACDLLYAFPATDRTGGTENTILWARKLRKKVILL